MVQLYYIHVIREAYLVAGDNSSVPTGENWKEYAHLACLSLLLGADHT